MKQDIQTDKLALAFELADDRQIASLAKEYAQANDSFAEYIVEKILPDSPNDEDLYEEIDSIFDVNSSSYEKRYKPYCDWYEIGQATWRFIKKLKTMLDTDNELTACYCSIHLLQRICEMYIEDEVWNDQDLDGDDFGADDTLDIIVKVLSADDLELDYKLEIIEDVREIATLEACTGYGIGDFSKFERLARKITMGAEDYLADLQ